MKAIIYAIKQWWNKLQTNYNESKVMPCMQQAKLVASKKEVSKLYPIRRESKTIFYLTAEEIEEFGEEIKKAIEAKREKRKQQQDIKKEIG